MNGLLKIDKEAGYTSQDVDCLIKKTFQTKRVGHLGTLDPFATGLLILGVNDGTKMLPYIPDEEKTYVASLLFGKKTDTDDITGKVLEESNPPLFTEAELKSCLSSFLGKQEQIPSSFSAKHIHGKKAYQLAREGKEVILPPQSIFISSLRPLSYQGNVLTFEAEVSKGTYIRTLGKDMASRLGTIGTLISLRRTAIGSISLEGAKKAKEVRKEDLLPLLSLSHQIPQVEVTGKEAFLVKNGCPIEKEREEDYLFLMEKGILLAVYQKEKDNRYICKKGFFHGDH